MRQSVPFPEVLHKDAAMHVLTLLNGFSPQETNEVKRTTVSKQEMFCSYMNFNAAMLTLFHTANKRLLTLNLE